MEDLQSLRQRINDLDRDIVALVEERFQCAVQVARYKKAHNLPILDQSREEEVIERNLSLLDHDEFKQDMRKFYQALMDISKEIQERI